jgi:hypothetical protein
MAATGYDSPISPSSFVVVEQVERGSADLAPVRVVNGLVYLHRLGRKLFELYYDFTQDLDLATELTARARHLTAFGTYRHGVPAGTVFDRLDGQRRRRS